MMTDWTLIDGGTGGSSQASVDATSPGAGNSVLQIAGKQYWQNTTAGNILNCQVETYMKAAPDGIGFLGLRSTSTGNTGTEYFMQLDTPFNQLLISRSVANSVTNLVAITAPTFFVGTITSWQKWRFGTITNGSQVLVRLELWNANTSAYVVKVDYLDNSANRLTSAGQVRIGNSQNSNARLVSFDDTKIYTLA